MSQNISVTPSQDSVLSISPAIDSLAEKEQLGSFLKEYRVYYTKSQIVGIVGGGLAALLLTGLLLFTYFVVPLAFTILLVPGFILACVCLFITLYLAGYPLFYRSWRAYVYTEGMIVTRRGKTSLWRWSQIKTFWQQVLRGSRTGLYHKYTLLRKDGAKLTFRNQFPDVEELAATIEEKTINLLLPEALANYEEGRSIYCEPFQISQRGLKKGKELLPWDEIENIEVSSETNTFNISKKDKVTYWSSVRPGNIANLHLFLALIEHAMEEVE